jgi:hypothetical protein
MNRKGDFEMRNTLRTGADAVYLTSATVSYALDKAIATALSADLAKVYLNAMSTTNMATFYDAWNTVMSRVDEDPCDHTRPRSEWRNLFEGYDSLKRGILTRFRQRRRELQAARA